MSGEKDIFLKGQVARDFDFYRIREKVASQVKKANFFCFQGKVLLILIKFQN